MVVVVVVVGEVEEAEAREYTLDFRASVLYPSGTDLRMRMPTVRREAWTLCGRAGCAENVGDE